MSSWPVRPLSEIAEVRLGRQRSPKNHSGTQMRPYLRAANVGWDGLRLDDVKEMNFSDAEMDTYRLRPGDILLAEASGSPGEVGKPALWQGEIAECAFQNTLLLIRSKEVEPRFLLHYYRFMALTGRFVSESRGVGIHHLGRARLASWPTPVPPMPEQRCVVDLLEEHLSSLDAARRSLDSARQRLSVLQRSLIDRLASGQIIGPITETGLAAEWQWRSPVELAAPGRGSIAIGPFGSDLKTSDYRDSGVPLVFVRNVRASQFGVGNAKYVSAPKAASLTGHDVRRGDVLITKMGEPPGDAAVYDSPIPGIVTADVIRFRPGPDTDSAFLAAAINSSLVRRQILTITSGVAQKKVSLARFRANIEIPAPGLEMQLAAVRAVEPHLESARRLQSALASSEVRLQSLRRGVLTAAFSGRLTGRSSDSELVEELADQEAS